MTRKYNLRGERALAETLELFVINNLFRQVEARECRFAFY